MSRTRQSYGRSRKRSVWLCSVAIRFKSSPKIRDSSNPWQVWQWCACMCFECENILAAVDFVLFIKISWTISLEDTRTYQMLLALPISLCDGGTPNNFRLEGCVLWVPAFIAPGWFMNQQLHDESGWFRQIYKLSRIPRTRGSPVSISLITLCGMSAKTCRYYISYDAGRSITTFQAHVSNKPRRWETQALCDAIKLWKPAWAWAIL